MSDYIEALGIIAPKAVYKNLTPAQLVEHALRRGEGTLSETGALVVTTGKYTGRSPDDRFVVDAPNIHDDIDWGKVNVPISEEKYEAIYNRMTAYLQGRELFVFEGFAGADEQYHLPVRVVNELASQNKVVKEAQKAFDEYHDELSRANLDKAVKEYARIKTELEETNALYAANKKSVRELTEEIRKGGGRRRRDQRNRK